MNNSLEILKILTNCNVNEDDLKTRILNDNLKEQHELKLAVLFRRYYGVYKLSDEEELISPEEMIKNIVSFKRNERFTTNKYWSIWKENGYFFGFIEGFFHAQEGKNQLCKILGRTLDEDFLLNKVRRKEIKRKFGICNQIDYFKNPDIFVFRFQDLEEFRIFLRINKIERMVGKAKDMVKGMHYNIYTAVCEIAQDEALKEIFKYGVIDSNNKEVNKKFFDSSDSLTSSGLFAILSSFKGYGAKISKMVMNLVFDIKIIAVDRRVLRSSITLDFVNFSPVYIKKIKDKFNLADEQKKEIANKISSLSERYALHIAEETLNSKFINSAFLSEIDFLLFMYNGGDGWNYLEEYRQLDQKEDICRVGKCVFDETGVCKLRRKFEYREHQGETQEVAVLRYE